MSKKITSTVAVALALTMACGSALAEFKDFTVNGQKVTKAVQERVAAQTIASSPNPHSMIAVPDIEAQVKDMITDMVVMAQYAKKKGLDKNPDVQADVQSAVDSVLWQAAVDDYLKANPVTEKEMRAAYDKEAAPLKSSRKRSPLTKAPRMTEVFWIGSLPRSSRANWAS